MNDDQLATHRKYIETHWNLTCLLHHCWLFSHRHSLDISYLKQLTVLARFPCCCGPTLLAMFPCCFRPMVLLIWLYTCLWSISTICLTWQVKLCAWQGYQFVYSQEHHICQRTWGICPRRHWKRQNHFTETMKPIDKSCQIRLQTLIIEF